MSGYRDVPDNITGGVEKNSSGKTSYSLYAVFSLINEQTEENTNIAIVAIGRTQKYAKVVVFRPSWDIKRIAAITGYSEDSVRHCIECCREAVFAYDGTLKPSVFLMDLHEQRFLNSIRVTAPRGSASPPDEAADWAEARFLPKGRPLTPGWADDSVASVAEMETMAEDFFAETQIEDARAKSTAVAGMFGRPARVTGARIPRVSQEPEEER